MLANIWMSLRVIHSRSASNVVSVGEAQPGQGRRRKLNLVECFGRQAACQVAFRDGEKRCNVGGAKP